MHVYDNGQTGVGNGPKLQYLHHQRHIFALRQFVTADTIVTAADASWVTCQGSVSQSKYSQMPSDNIWKFHPDLLKSST